MRDEPLSLLRGTSAIGPLIAALKSGKSVEYEGKEVKTKLSSPVGEFVIIFVCY